MPAGKHKSRTLRRIHVRMPGGKTKIVYKQRKPKKQLCAECGAVLKGTLRLTKTQAGKTPKTKKRPQRAYGGVLCTRCARARIKETAR